MGATHLISGNYEAIELPIEELWATYISILHTTGDIMCHFFHFKWGIFRMREANFTFFFFLQHRILVFVYFDVVE